MALPANRKPTRSQIGTAASGAGGGTLLLLLVNAIPDSNPSKKWLLLLVPSVTIVIAYTARHAITFYNDFQKNRHIKKAKTTISSYLTNDQTSDTHKQTLRNKLEIIENIDVDNTIKRIEHFSYDNEEITKSKFTNNLTST